MLTTLWPAVNIKTTIPDDVSQATHRRFQQLMRWLFHNCTQAQTRNDMSSSPLSYYPLPYVFFPTLPLKCSQPDVLQTSSNHPSYSRCPSSPPQSSSQPQSFSNLLDNRSQIVCSFQIRHGSLSWTLSQDPVLCEFFPILSPESSQGGVKNSHWMSRNVWIELSLF